MALIETNFPKNRRWGRKARAMNLPCGCFDCLRARGITPHRGDPHLMDINRNPHPSNGDKPRRDEGQPQPQEDTVATPD